MFGVIELFVLPAIMLASPVLSFPRAYYEPNRQEIERMLGGSSVTAYDLPYMCSLHYTEDYFPIGTCSIITARVVLTSMETMDYVKVESADELVKRRKIGAGFDPMVYQHFTKAQLNLRQTRFMTVAAGKDTLRPNQEIKLLKNYQESRIEHYYAVDSSDGYFHGYDYSTDDISVRLDFRNNTQQDYDFFSFNSNFMFLSLQTSFRWTTHVLPIPVVSAFSDDWKYMRQRTHDFQNSMNSMDINEYADRFSQGQFCTVGGWALRDDQPLTFKEVMFVTKTFCQTCFCSYEPSCCLEYPRDIDLCFTSTAYGDVCDFDQGEACHPYEPFKCPGDGACISIQYLCDGAPDCLDGYDEDSRLCTAAKRPPVEETSSFLQSLLASHGPNYLEKLFGSKARDALAPLGGVDKVAITLSESQTIEDFGAALHLMRSDLEHLRSVFMAVENGDLGMLKSLGIKDSELGDVKFFLEKLVNTGFLD